MNMTARLKAAEAALAKKNSTRIPYVLILSDGETEGEARARFELANGHGLVTFITAEDAKLG